MADLVSIFNMALSNAGQNQTLASPTEAGTSAATLRRFYDVQRDAVLEAAPWKFATRTQALALYPGAAPYPWAHAYQQPPDCLFVQRVLPDGGRLDQPPVPYELGGATTDEGYERTLILTDLPGAWLRYTRRVEDVSRYSAGFCNALAWRLAWAIAPALSISRDWRQDAWQWYLRALDEAITADARQAWRDEPAGELLDARA